MRTNFRTRILTNVTEMRGIVSDWSNLHERCPKSTPFQSPEWILAWADAFSPEKMRVVEVRRGDMLVGLAPLLIFPRGDEDVLAFMAGGVSDYLDVVVDPRFACQACSAILEATAEIEGWTILDFTDLPATSVLHRTDLVQFKVPHDRCSSLKLPEAKQELLQVLSKRQRANLRNACSRLQRAGGGTFELASAETLPEFLEDLFRLHTDRWSQLGEAGVLADEKVRILHCQAAPHLLRRGTLGLYRLRVNDRTVAALYTLLGCETVYCYLQGFDPEFAHLSPGTQLMFFALENAIQRGMRKFDLLRGDEAYKKHWRSAPEATYRIQLPRSALNNLALLRQYAA